MTKWIGYRICHPERNEVESKDLLAKLGKEWQEERNRVSVQQPIVGVNRNEVRRSFDALRLLRIEGSPFRGMTTVLRKPAQITQLTNRIAR